MITIACSKCSKPVECADGTVRIVCSVCTGADLEAAQVAAGKNEDADPLFVIKELVWRTEVSIEVMVKIRYAGERRFSFEVEPGVPDSQIEQLLLTEIHKRADVFARRTKLTNPMIGFKAEDKRQKTLSDLLGTESDSGN